MYISNALRCLLLGLTALLGDHLVLIYQNENVTKAACDNLTHAVIGVVTWINVQYYFSRAATFSSRVLCDSILCGLISSAIDIDHFIAARSLHLKDATNLSRRPLFHCTTLPLVAWSIILFIAWYWNSNNLETWGWIMLAAFLSHHIRDAARRGFWLCPFGSSPPLGLRFYIIFIVLLPALLSIGMTYTSTSEKRLRWQTESVSVV